MAIVSPPKLNQIYWTAYSPVEGDSSPVDALRFETYAERLGNSLFPGITNRVERVRYFGMVCAGIQAADAEIGRSVSGREHTRLVRQRFVKFEAAWAFAQVADKGRQIKERPPGATRPRLRYEYRGFRGANRALGFWVKTGGQPTVDGRNKYRLLQAQEAQGGLGAYLVSLREHGFVQGDRLALTEAGTALVEAFYANTQAKTRAILASDGKPDRAVWRYAGVRFALPAPNADERRLVAEALFSPDRTLGRFVVSLPEELRGASRAKEAFAFVAGTASAEASAARYTLAFDDLRRACLALFGAVGAALHETAPRRAVDVLPSDELASMSEAVQQAANVIARLQAPRGLEAIAALAVELVTCAKEDVMMRLVDFHRREGRRWIEAVGGDRLQLGAAGTFQDPGDRFHGYTLGAALSVYADTIGAPA